MHNHGDNQACDKDGRRAGKGCDWWLGLWRLG